MKVPTRRRGNLKSPIFHTAPYICLNESPHPKAGKFLGQTGAGKSSLVSLNESPHPKAGKFAEGLCQLGQQSCLNESPHPKAGKSMCAQAD